MEELAELGKLHGYVELQVENVLSPEMLAWCRKHGLNEKVGEAPSFWREL